MLPAMTLGAVGCVDGPPGVMPELWVAIWEAYRAGDLVEAEAAQNRASEAVEALLACGGGFHATATAAIGLRLGVDCGSPRPPALPLASAQREALERAMKELGLKS